MLSISPSIFSTEASPTSPSSSAPSSSSSSSSLWAILLALLACFLPFFPFAFFANARYMPTADAGRIVRQPPAPPRAPPARVTVPSTRCDARTENRDGTEAVGSARRTTLTTVVVWRGAAPSRAALRSSRRPSMINRWVCACVTLCHG